MEILSPTGNIQLVNITYEQKIPVFEAGHVVTTYDHFHRFGYLLARKVK